MSEPVYTEGDIREILAAANRIVMPFWLEEIAKAKNEDRLVETIDEHPIDRRARVDGLMGDMTAMAFACRLMEATCNGVARALRENRLDRHLDTAAGAIDRAVGRCGVFDPRRTPEFRRWRSVRGTRAWV